MNVCAFLCVLARVGSGFAMGWSPTQGVLPVSSQNFRVFGLFPSFCILENRKHDVAETASVSVLR
jgi:hypothetical protein